MTDSNDYALNLDTLIDSTSCSSSARILALSLKLSNGYLTVGDLLKKIPDEFLNRMMVITEISDKDVIEKIQGEILEIALVFNHAEGGSINESDVDALANSTSVLLVMESLSRKGLVKLEYQNASLTDRLDAPLAEITELGKDLVKKFGMGGDKE